MRFSDADYPAAPYPGLRPAFSFVHVSGGGHVIEAGGSVDGRPLDEWLAERSSAASSARVPVLSYGSNANPSKITWLRENLRLDGPVVVLRVHTRGLAAVWACGRRVVDEQRPATLTAAPGVTETHAVWLATRDQIEVLDVCEGRGDRYALARVHTGDVVDENGVRIDAPLAYVGVSAHRMPLLVDGSVVRCAEVPQHAAAALTGVPADSHGLDVTEVVGFPA